jgi:CHAT domain-containing protein
VFLVVGVRETPPTPRLLYEQARAAADRGDSAKVDSITADALKWFGDSDDEWVWRIRAVRAEYLTSSNEQALQARELLQRPFPKSLRGTEVEVLLLQSLAFAGLRLHDPEADGLIERAYVLAKQKYPQSLAKVLIYRTMIDSRNVPKWASEAAIYAKKYGQADIEVRARGMVGYSLANAERFDEAIRTWEPALSRARQLPKRNLATEQKTEGNLGWAYMELGDYENAAEFFTQAYANALRTGQPSDAVIWMYQLGNVRFRQGDLAGAEKQFRAAYDIVTKTKHRQRAIVLALLADYSLQVGRLAEAQRYCEESLRERRDPKTKDVDGELRSLSLAGAIATAAGKFDQAEKMLNEVLARSTKSLAIESEAHRRLAQLYVRQGKSAAAEEQFGVSIKQVRKARREVSDPELQFSYFTGVAELFENYVEFLIARGRKEEALAVTETSRAQTLEEGLLDTNTPRDVRLIARDTGATILCYWLGTAHSYLWIVTPQKVDLIPLPPKQTIEDAISRYQNALFGVHGSLNGSGTQGEALWKMLVEPAVRSIPSRSRVIVVPHGRLAAFNMETLVVPGPGRHYWIEDTVLSTAGSLGLLGQKEPKTTAAPRLLLVGNAPSPGPEFPPLAQADREMKRVASHFAPGRSVILSGPNATPSAYRAKSPEGFTHLHFVAHGVAARLKPLDSAIVLAREGDTFKLYARDIAQQPLTARLVTISSCEGAGTRAYAGEGLVGLGWAFLRAGADNVVAALWKVNDNATAELMDQFYASLAKGAEPAAALRDAKLFLIRRGGSFSLPRYWAPFLLYGRS